MCHDHGPGKPVIHCDARFRNKSFLHVFVNVKTKAKATLMELDQAMLKINS